MCQTVKSLESKTLYKRDEHRIRYSSAEWPTLIIQWFIASIRIGLKMFKAQARRIWKCEASTETRTDPGT